LGLESWLQAGDDRTDVIGHHDESDAPGGLRVQCVDQHPENNPFGVERIEQSTLAFTRKRVEVDKK
jgi:hypothetical protein